VSPERPRRTVADRLVGPLLGMLFARAVVAGIEQITPRMRLIRLSGPELSGLAWTPGQQVRVRVRDPRGRTALRAGARVYGAIEVAHQDDRLPLPRTDELSWRFRGDVSAAASAGLVSAVRDLDLPAQPGAAYLAGEARTCQAIRVHLVTERGWPRRSVLVKPFWAPGKRGLE
jgi:NADPH-dependent ferric siderophore reductase